MRERLREQPVGEPRVARQERPVQVRPDRHGRRGSPRSRSRRRCRSRRRRARAARAPASRRVRPAWFSKPASVRCRRLELALEQDVADHPPLAGDRVEREHADARAARRRGGRGRSARAAGSRRRRRAPRRRRRPPRAAPRAFAREVGRDQRLLAVLAAADVEQVVLVRAGPARRGRSRAPRARGPRSAARRESTAMLPRSA